MDEERRCGAWRVVLIRRRRGEAREGRLSTTGTEAHTDGKLSTSTTAATIIPAGARAKPYLTQRTPVQRGMEGEGLRTFGLMEWRGSKQEAEAAGACAGWGRDGERE